MSISNKLYTFVIVLVRAKNIHFYYRIELLTDEKTNCERKRIEQNSKIKINFKTK